MKTFIAVVDCAAIGTLKWYHLRAPIAAFRVLSELKPREYATSALPRAAAVFIRFTASIESLGGRGALVARHIHILSS